MNTQLLLDHLRVIPDFPIPGIQFQDVTTLFANPACLSEMTTAIADIYKHRGITKVVGIESRGFVLAATTAVALNAGVVLCRKPGKLPAETISETYAKEYGTDTICIHADAITEDDVVLIHDDLLATGGSLTAAYNLVSRFHPKAIYANVVIELTIEGLCGRSALPDGCELTALLTI